MTEQELKALAKGYYGVDGYVWHEDVVMRLFEDNARLRGLIKQTEEAIDGYCPWCGSFSEHLNCPAFNPDGEVK